MQLWHCVLSYRCRTGFTQPWTLFWWAPSPPFVLWLQPQNMQPKAWSEQRSASGGSAGPCGGRSPWARINLQIPWWNWISCCSLCLCLTECWTPRRMSLFQYRGWWWAMSSHSCTCCSGGRKCVASKSWKPNQRKSSSTKVTHAWSAFKSPQSTKCRQP